MSEKEAEIKISFLSSKEIGQISNCYKVKTDVTFEIQYHQSSPISQIRYINLHVDKVEKFEFKDNSEIVLKFDGHALSCYSTLNKCQSLKEGEPIPIVLLSFHFKPQKGYKPTWNTLDAYLNKFSIKGSHYSVECAGI